MSRTSDKWAGFVYETTNNINGKRYVGLSTKSTEDGYLGSGTLIKAAIEKYGTRKLLQSDIVFLQNERNAWKERNRIHPKKETRIQYRRGRPVAEILSAI